MVKPSIARLACGFTDIYVEHMVNSNREYISSVIINFKIYKRVSLLYLLSIKKVASAWRA